LVGVAPVADLSNTVPGSKQQQNALFVDPRDERGGMFLRRHHLPLAKIFYQLLYSHNKMNQPKADRYYTAGPALAAGLFCCQDMFFFPFIEERGGLTAPPNPQLLHTFALPTNCSLRSFLPHELYTAFAGHGTDAVWVYNEIHNIPGFYCRVFLLSGGLVALLEDSYRHFCRK